jgi:hypothetical protein
MLSGKRSFGATVSNRPTAHDGLSVLALAVSFHAEDIVDLVHLLAPRCDPRVGFVTGPADSGSSNHNSTYQQRDHDKPLRRDHSANNLRVVNRESDSIQGSNFMRHSKRTALASLSANRGPLFSTNRKWLRMGEIVVFHDGSSPNLGIGKDAREALR